MPSKLKNKSQKKKKGPTTEINRTTNSAPFDSTLHTKRERTHKAMQNANSITISKLYIYMAEISEKKNYLEQSENRSN